MYHIMRIMVKKLAPKRDPQREVEGVMRNLLVSITSYIRFDVEDLYLRRLLIVAQQLIEQKPYTPWLMQFIMKNAKGCFCSTVEHVKYLPAAEAPVLDHAP